LAQARDRSIVISGDTAPSQNLVKLAAGADVLVHSVLFPIADALPPAALRSATTRSALGRSLAKFTTTETMSAAAHGPCT